MPTPPLKVYKASAGSGKTFTLAVEYIKLLVNNPMSYRHILAVTFTNKATEEMKTRILSQLNGLAHGYADSQNYMDKITAEMGITQEQVQENAGIALKSLIHDYSSFRVETIDKFFQRVLKNLARELDLTANLRVELNDMQVEQLAVDSMIEQLNNEDQLLGWLMKYILENINDDKSWNIIGQVKKFGENIFKDTYKAHREHLTQILSDEHFFDRYRRQLHEIIQSNKDKMVAHAQHFFDVVEGYDAQDFAYNTSGIYGYFMKMLAGNFGGGEAGSRIKACMESSDKWCKKDSPKFVEITRLADSQLMDILRAAESDRADCYRLCKSAELTLSHLNQLRLLAYIEKMVRDLNNDANRFLLSDTQSMLNALIDDSDTPFIFEKIGAPLRHIMIDEFQDTGTLQWRNFKILLDNCMSQGFSNLIVGDVKQSIYRWRSGDWRLLNSIKNEFHDDSLVDEQPLKTNYRSSRKVIEFNNVFFTAACRIEYERLLKMTGEVAEQLATAYSDVEQKVPDSKGNDGYVRVELLEEKEYDQHLMEHIAQAIKSLTDMGVPQRDIAILARRNSEIEETAKYFQTHVPEISIVSDEAYRLDFSISVNILIAALRVISNEKDIINKAMLAKAWNNTILGKQLSDDIIMLATDTQNPCQAFCEWLPKGFNDDVSLAKLRALPLTDLVESLYNIFNLDLAEGQGPYICTFYDIIADHLKDNTSDIDRFLSAWDEQYHKKTIHGDDVDGVRIVSIHKSKGLEFDNVILPFCNWKLEPFSNTIWCEAKEPPFDELPILPVDYSKKQMLNTIYEDEYKREHLQNTVDNLNLLYVAFTRAKSRLFIYGTAQKAKSEKKGGKDNKDENAIPSTRSILIEESLNKIDSTIELRQKLTGCSMNRAEDNSLLFEYGDIGAGVSGNGIHHTEESNNVFLQPDQSVHFTMKSYPMTAQFRQSNNSRAFTTTDEGEILRSEYIERGNLLHHIFSKIKTTEDFDKVLFELMQEGILYDEVSPNELQQLLTHALDNPKVRDWFSPRWQLHNECAIVYVDSSSQVKTLRPDRVMSNGKKTIVVDFKFGRPRKGHKTQVARYMKLLQEMGNKRVEGYLWYVDSCNIVKI